MCFLYFNPTWNKLTIVVCWPWILAVPSDNFSFQADNFSFQADETEENVRRLIDSEVHNRRQR